MLHRSTFYCKSPQLLQYIHEWVEQGKAVSDQAAHRHTHHQLELATYNIAVLQETFYVYDDYDHAYDDHVYYDPHPHLDPHPDHACAHDFDSDYACAHDFDCVHAHVNDHVYTCDCDYDNVSVDIQAGVVEVDELGQMVREVEEGFVMLGDMHRLGLQGPTENYRADGGQKGESALW